MLKIGLGILVIFLVLLLAEFNGLFGIVDPRLTVFTQSLIPRNLDVGLSFFSLMGSFEITALITGILGLIWWHRTKKFPWGLGFFGVLLIIELIGKTILIHPGPPSEFFRTTLPFYFPTAHVETNGSFPSGHVSRMIFLMVLGIFFAGKRRLYLVSCILVFAVVMAVSRVYLGEHWTSDVLGGLLLGSSMGIMAVRFL